MLSCAYVASELKLLVIWFVLNVENVQVSTRVNVGLLRR